MTLRRLARSRPLTCYFGLAYGIAWGGILAVLATKRFDVASIKPADTVPLIACMLAGPSIGGLAMTALVDGRAGLRELWARFTTWRVGARAAAIALLTAPALMLVVLAAFGAVVSHRFFPGFRAEGPIVGLLAGGLEELGWTGFATPRLLERRGPLAAGLVLGLAWSTWHVLADYAGNIAAMGRLWPIWFVVFWTVPLTAYRVLMTSLHARTRSLGLAMVMHASYTGWLYTLSPTLPTADGLRWQAAFAAALCVAVALAVAGERRAARA